MAKLTQDQINVSHAWLHDVFVWGGLIKNPTRDIPASNYRYMYARVIDSVGQDAATTICDAIKFRPVEYIKFQDFDKALYVLADRRFMPNLHEKNYWSSNRTYKKPDMLAKYIANLCAERKYYWSNDATSATEMDQIKQTILGSALWEYRCFTSQVTNKASTTASSSTRAQSNKQPGQAPQNGYKSTGPQSANVKCLVGQPNNKTTFNGQLMYCIEADKIGKNTPNAFIKPLDSKACPSGIAIIYMGSGNGYTDCKCWFTSLADANAFMSNCINKFGNKFTNIHVSKANADSNGYYPCQTEFGRCFIKASKLNEALQEEAKKVKKQPKIILTKSMVVEDIDAFESAMYK